MIQCGEYATIYEQLIEVQTEKVPAPYHYAAVALVTKALKL